MNRGSCVRELRFRTRARPQVTNEGDHRGRMETAFPSWGTVSSLRDSMYTQPTRHSRAGLQIVPSLRD
jgi:hypothetical protein